MLQWPEVRDLLNGMICQCGRHIRRSNVFLLLLCYNLAQFLTCLLLSVLHREYKISAYTSKFEHESAVRGISCSKQRLSIRLPWPGQTQCPRSRALVERCTWKLQAFFTDMYVLEDTMIRHGCRRDLWAWSSILILIFLYDLQSGGLCFHDVSQARSSKNHNRSSEASTGQFHNSLNCEKYWIQAI